MKNILYLHTGAELYGADIVLLNLIKGIDKQKNNIHVILPCDGPLVKKMEENDIKVEIISYPILRRQYFNIKGIVKYVKEYIKCANTLVKKVKEYNIEILHVNTMAVLEGIYIKKKTKIKLIWHIHEILKKPKVVVKILTRLVAKYSNNVIAVSCAVKENLQKQADFKDKIQVIYNGVDNNVFNSNNEIQYLKKEFSIPKEAIIVGMMGRINAWKGQKHFLEATIPLLNRYNKLYIMLVGGVFEGQEWRREELKEIIQGQDNANRIILVDFREDSKNIHNLFDIFVLPSVEPDPLPTVVLEAMACKKPIVAYKHGGVCEMVEMNYNGFFAEPNNIEELSNKIEKMLLTNYKDMGEKSYIRQTKYFSLQNYISNFAKLYDQ